MTPARDIFTTAAMATRRVQLWFDEIRQETIRIRTIRLGRNQTLERCVWWVGLRVMMAAAILPSIIMDQSGNQTPNAMRQITLELRVAPCPLCLQLGKTKVNAYVKKTLTGMMRNIA